MQVIFLPRRRWSVVLLMVGTEVFFISRSHKSVVIRDYLQRRSMKVLRNVFDAAINLSNIVVAQARPFEKSILNHKEWIQYINDIFVTKSNKSNGFDKLGKWKLIP